MSKRIRERSHRGRRTEAREEADAKEEKAIQDDIEAQEALLIAKDEEEAEERDSEGYSQEELEHGADIARDIGDDESS